jgi:tetratricopeptide (TPR) repeat protein
MFRDCYRNCFFLAKYIDLKLANYKEALSRYVIIHDVDALGNKGADLDALGNHTGVIEYYDKALAINPKDVDALTDKGVALKELGNHSGGL